MACARIMDSRGQHGQVYYTDWAGGKRGQCERSADCQERNWRRWQVFTIAAV